MNQDIGETGYILIVNNDPAMREAVSSYFFDQKFPTRCLSDWSKLKCTGMCPSLIIMDQPLGLHDGLDRLRSIRSKSDIPVIITSHRVEDVDPVVNLELGADDYIVRPSPSPTFSTGASKQGFWGCGKAKTRVGSMARFANSSVV
jgi:DNA-binding response OmpR family regulator